MFSLAALLALAVLSLRPRVKRRARQETIRLIEHKWDPDAIPSPCLRRRTAPACRACSLSEGRGDWWRDGVVALGIAGWPVVEGRRVWAAGRHPDHSGRRRSWSAESGGQSGGDPRVYADGARELRAEVSRNHLDVQAGLGRLDHPPVAHLDSAV